MAKTCPGCGYHPIGPFIDNCPICAEPVRNVRSGGCRSGGGPFNVAPWAQWVVGAVLLGALVMAGRWAFSSRHPDVEDTRRMMEQLKAQREIDLHARTIVVSAKQLIEEFQNDSHADRKYRGKYLEISGVVERQGMDGDEIPFVIVNGGDVQSKIKIECMFDDADAENEVAVSRLRKGRTVTVRGEYNGRVSNVKIGECVLVSRGQE